MQIAWCRGIKVLNLFFIAVLSCGAQSSYTFTPDRKNEDCTKGRAGIKIEGLKPVEDTLTLTWSTGETNVFSIKDLIAGEYAVRIQINQKVDSTLVIIVEKEECKVVISNHFTPNGDNYNDRWQIRMTEYYPRFEIYVFNKWGQQVHSQKGDYTPWDGTWNGIMVADGTYYYIFYYDRSKDERLEKGDVSILR
jgi:gliding motility-associated-like protein